MPLDGVLDIDVELLDHQAELVLDTWSDILALEGGLGSGKTMGGLLKMLALIEAYPTVPGLWVEPTFDLIGSIFLPSIEEFFEKWGVPYEYRTVWRGRRHVLIVYPGEGRETPVYLRSGDKPQRIVGFKVGWFVVDEADQQDREVWKRCSQRLRDKRPKRRQQIAVFTPEEGFNWTHDLFHTEEVPEGLTRRVIEGIRTDANVFNPAEYVARISAGVDEDELQRILSGKRSTKTGLVYKRFSRERHARPCANPTAGQVFIGADFNVNPMVWLFGRRLGHEIHFWGECAGEFIDTIEMCQRARRMLRDTWADAGDPISEAEAARRCEIVPDASCNQRRTSADGTASDLDHLIRSGFDVRRPSKNPPVKDRIFSMNLGFHEDRIFVDPERCPLLMKCLTQQGWSASRNEPDKAKGLDHAPDAAGYPVHFYEPAHAPRGNLMRAA